MENLQVNLRYFREFNSLRTQVPSESEISNNHTGGSHKTFRDFGNILTN